MGFLIVILLIKFSNLDFEYSKLFLISYFVLAGFTLPIFKRYSKKLLFKKLSFFKNRVFIIGDKKYIKKFMKEIEENWYLGLKFDSQNFKSIYIYKKICQKI